MKKVSVRLLIRYGLPSVVALCGLMQFVPVAYTNPPVESDIGAPPAVQSILRKACYDCHSHESVWPWYSQVAPISWLVVSDVNEGREELNFSTWGSYDAKKQAKKLKEIDEEIQEGEMAPWTYTIIHRDAVLSQMEKEIVQKWARGE